MQKKFKRTIALIIAITFLLTATMPAFAATTGYVTQKDGKYLEYDIIALADSYEYFKDNPDSPEAALYKNFVSGKAVAEIDSEKGYMDLEGLANAYEEGNLEEYKAGTPALLPGETLVSVVTADLEGNVSIGEEKPITPPVQEADLTAYNAALAAVNEADYTEESWAAYQEVVDANVVTVDNKQAEVDAATAAIVAAQAGLVKKPVALAVEAVSAINAKTLKVEFNGAVAKDDQAKATFDVKRGTIATAVEATWAEDGKSVQLARATNLLAGTYTVTVGGLEFAEGKNVGTVEVTAQKIAKLEIVSDNIIRDGAAKLSYKVYDQYGEELAKNANTFNWTVVNTTDITRVAEANPGAFAYLEIDTDGSDTSGNGIVSATGADVGDVLRITGLLASDPSVKAVKEVTVSNIFVNSFELGEVVLPKDATMLVQNAGYVEVKYAALDNFGNAVELDDVIATANNDTVNGIQFITSDAAIIPTGDAADNFKVTNGKLEVKVLNKAGDVVLTALNTNTGATSSINVKVNATAALATVEFGDFKDEIVAGDLAGTAKLGVTFFDQYGEAVDGKSLAFGSTALPTAGPFVVSVVPSVGLKVNPILDADGYMVFVEDDPAVAAGTYTITLTHGTTGASVSKQVTVNKARVPNELKVKTAPDASVAKSGSTDVEFEVKDQYGKDVAVGKLGSYVIKAASKNSKVTPPANITSASANYKVSIAGLAEGADVVTFTLEDGSSKVIDSVSFNIDVVADLATLDVSTDKTEYTAGNDITVTIKAEKAGPVAHTTFNQSGVATIIVGSKTYLRTVTFVNGVATTTVPATKAGASVTVNATFDSKTDASAPNVKVVEAAASKFVLANNTADLDITLQDDFGNIITAFAGDKVVKVTYPAAADITGSGIDAEGNAVVTFANGAGSITFADTALVGGTYTVTFEGYTGTLEVK